MLRTNDTNRTPHLEWVNISYLTLAVSGNANISIRNTLNGTYVVSNASMTNFDTGLYNYTWSTSVQSTYLAVVKCNVSNKEYIGVKEFSTQNIAGGGTTSTGGLPLNIFSSVGGSYNPGDEVSIHASITNSSGMLVNATINNSVYYPNGTLLTRGLSTEQSLGIYNFSFRLLSSDPLGTYSVRIDANYSGNEIHDSLAFIVTTATTTSGSGGLPLNIYNDVGASYQPGATLRIFSTVINSTGRLVNATVNITIYEPDGSLENSSLSTLQTTGRYSYSYVLPSTEGTYRIEIDANYSGDEIHDSLAFTVSTAAGGGGGNATVPEVIVDAPAAININTLFDIIALTKSSSGLAADCSTDASITIRNTLNGTNVVTSAPMTKFDTWLYNYTWSTSVQSTYLAIVKCTILAVEYTGIKEFSTQDIAGGTTSTGAEIIVDAPAVINTNTKFDIISLARSSTGAPVNCDVITSSNGTFVDDVYANWTAGMFINTSANNPPGYGNITLNQRNGDNRIFVDDVQANWTAGTFINTSTNSSAGYGNITLNQTSGNYSLNGTFTSQVFNAGNAASWINLTWNSNQPAGTNISIDVRSCSQSDCSDGIWSNNISYSSPLILNATITPNSRYFQYKAALRTNDTNRTPHLEWINISYLTLAVS